MGWDGIRRDGRGWDDMGWVGSRIRGWSGGACDGVGVGWGRVRVGWDGWGGVERAGCGAG